MSSYSAFTRGFILCTLLLSGVASAADRKPNILVIMADDIGPWNVSTLSPRDDGRSHSKY